MTEDLFELVSTVPPNPKAYGLVIRQVLSALEVEETTETTEAGRVLVEEIIIQLQQAMHRDNLDAIRGFLDEFRESVHECPLADLSKAKLLKVRLAVLEQVLECYLRQDYAKRYKAYRQLTDRRGSIQAIVDEPITIIEHLLWPFLWVYLRCVE